MELVATLKQVRANVETLELVRQGQRPSESAAYEGLIKRGTCFLPYAAGDGLAFAPSRFIGYVGNSFDKHAVNERRDGRLTNGAINSILLQTPTIDPQLEAEYLHFCAKIGVKPSRTGTFGVARKYWVVPEMRERLDFIAEASLLDDRNLTLTEKDQLIKARVGQGAFRDALLAYWKSRCCVTACAIKPVLRASHIKPWRVSTYTERLDPFNGLLLTANIDILFDRGLISFSDDGALLRSSAIDAETLAALGCRSDLRIKLEARHAPYLDWHRIQVFGSD